MFRSLYVAIFSHLKNKSQIIHENMMNFVPLVTERREHKVVRVIITDIDIYIYI
jgi:hypothetical protein